MSHKGQQSRLFHCSPCGFSGTLTANKIQSHRRKCTNQTVKGYYPLPNVEVVPKAGPASKKANAPKEPNPYTLWYVHQRIGQMFYCLRCKKGFRPDNSLQGHTRQCTFKGDPTTDPVTIAHALTQRGTDGSMDGQSTVHTFDSTLALSSCPSSPSATFNHVNHDDPSCSTQPSRSQVRPNPFARKSSVAPSPSDERVIDLTQDVSAPRSSSSMSGIHRSRSVAKENDGPFAHPPPQPRDAAFTGPPKTISSSSSALTRPPILKNPFLTPTHSLSTSTAQSPGFQALSISTSINRPQRTPIVPSRRPTPASHSLTRGSAPFLSSLRPGNLLASPINAPIPRTPIFNPARRLDFKNTPTLSTGQASSHDRRYTPYQRPLGTTASGQTIISNGGRLVVATPRRTYAAAVATAPEPSQSRSASVSKSATHRTPFLTPSIPRPTPAPIIHTPQPFPRRTPQPFPRLTPSPPLRSSPSSVLQTTQRASASREPQASVPRMAPPSSTPRAPPPSVPRPAPTPGPSNARVPVTPRLSLSPHYRNPPASPITDVEDEPMIIPVPILDGDISDILQGMLDTLTKKCPLCYYQGLPHEHKFDQCALNVTAKLANRFDTQYERWKGEVYFEKPFSHCWGCYIPAGRIIQIEDKRDVKFHLGNMGLRGCKYKDTITPMIYLAWRAGNMPYLLERFEGIDAAPITENIKTFSAWIVSHDKKVIPPSLLILYSIFLIRGYP